MKSKETKRNEAYERLLASTYENSKAKRLGTKTEEEWDAWKDEALKNHK